MKLLFPLLTIIFQHFVQLTQNMYKYIFQNKEEDKKKLAFSEFMFTENSRLKAIFSIYWNHVSLQF